MWKVASPRDAWFRIGHHISSADFARFEAVAYDVFSSRDPRYEMNAGDRWLASVRGVQLSGWDGICNVANGTEHIPSGNSGWEIGTQRQAIKAKADDDYTKRTANPLGLDRKITLLADPMGGVAPTMCCGSRSHLGLRSSMH